MHHYCNYIFFQNEIVHNFEWLLDAIRRKIGVNNTSVDCTLSTIVNGYLLFSFQEALTALDGVPGMQHMTGKQFDYVFKVHETITLYCTQLPKS